MWNWYSNAAICLAYLADVEHGNDNAVAESFSQSEWFNRGWTLQELLAPRDLLFLDAQWNLIGRRSYTNAIQRQVHEDYDLEFPYSWQYRGNDRYVPEVTRYRAPSHIKTFLSSIC